MHASRQHSSCRLMGQRRDVWPRACGHSPSTPPCVLPPPPLIPIPIPTPTQPNNQVLRAHGVKVLTVRDILAFGVEERIGARVELEDLAADTLTYKLAEGERTVGGASWGGWAGRVSVRRAEQCSNRRVSARRPAAHSNSHHPSSVCVCTHAGHNEGELAETDRHYLSDNYKREVVGAMSTSQVGGELCWVGVGLLLLINPWLCKSLAR